MDVNKMNNEIKYCTACKHWALRNQDNPNPEYNWCSLHNKDIRPEIDEDDLGEPACESFEQLDVTETYGLPRKTQVPETITDERTVTWMLPDLEDYSVVRERTPTGERTDIYHFDDSRWCPHGDTSLTGKIRAKRNELLKAINEEKPSPDEDDYRAWKKRYNAVLSYENLPGLTRLSKTFETVSSNQRQKDEFDEDYNIIAFKNGYVYDIQKKEFRKTRREDKNSFTVAVDYEPEARCPQFLRMLDECLNSDTEAIKYLQMLVGSSLLRKVAIKAQVYLVGPSDTRKTTMVNVLTNVLGDYAVGIPTSALSSKSAGEVMNPTILRTANLAFCGCDEKNNGKSDSSSFDKAMTGGANTLARGLYRDVSHFRMTATIFNTCNELPSFQGLDLAQAKRKIVIRFLNSFMGKRIAGYDRILAADEGPGIMNWILEGLRTYLALTNDILAVMPESVKRDTETYKLQNNSIDQFLKEKCACQKKYKIVASELEEAYKEYCDKELGNEPVDLKTFRQYLKNRSNEYKPMNINGQTKRGYSGIRLLTETEIEELDRQVSKEQNDKSPVIVQDEAQTQLSVGYT